MFRNIYFWATIKVFSFFLLSGLDQSISHYFQKIKQGEDNMLVNIINDWDNTSALIGKKVKALKTDN